MGLIQHQLLALCTGGGGGGVVNTNDDRYSTLSSV